jgi:riboflavin kinase
MELIRILGGVALLTDLNLPDLSFVRKTEEKFNVNRGVYNTIDAWFYDYGIEDIVERRSHITQFLVYSTKEVENDRLFKRLHFPDGLTNTLETYVERYWVRKQPKHKVYN